MSFQSTDFSSSFFRVASFICLFYFCGNVASNGFECRWHEFWSTFGKSRRLQWKESAKPNGENVSWERRPRKGANPCKKRVSCFTHFERCHIWSVRLSFSSHSLPFRLLFRHFLCCVFVSRFAALSSFWNLPSYIMNDATQFDSIQFPKCERQTIFLRNRKFQLATFVCMCLCVASFDRFNLTRSK